MGNGISVGFIRHSQPVMRIAKASKSRRGCGMLGEAKLVREKLFANPQMLELVAASGMVQFAYKPFNNYNLKLVAKETKDINKLRQWVVDLGLKANTTVTSLEEMSLRDLLGNASLTKKANARFRRAASQGSIVKDLVTPFAKTQKEIPGQKKSWLASILNGKEEFLFELEYIGGDTIYIKHNAKKPLSDADRTNLESVVGDGLNNNGLPQKYKDLKIEYILMG